MGFGKVGFWENWVLGKLELSESRIWGKWVFGESGIRGTVGFRGK